MSNVMTNSLIDWSGNKHLLTAFREAQKCLLCYDPPCSRDCPAGTDPGKFIRQLAFKNFRGAARTIKNNNLFGLSCGYLCPSEKLCEKNCIFNNNIEPKQIINIKYIQKELMEYYYDSKFNLVQEIPHLNSRPFGVIGSGPAGLACAYELAHNGHKVEVYEKMPMIGAMLRYGIPESRYPKSKLDADIRGLDHLGIIFHMRHDFGGTSEELMGFLKRYDALFIAIGLWDPKRLFDDSKLYSSPQIFSSLDFLKLAKMGEIDQGEFKGKSCIVVGGGSAAIDCAKEALKLEAKDVSIFYRRSFLDMPAGREEVHDAFEKGIKFFFNNLPVSYNFGKSEILESVTLAWTRVEDEQVQRDYERKTWDFNTDIIIEAIGNYSRIKIDTSIDKLLNKRIFIGGDFSYGPGLVVNAVKDGKAAAKRMMELRYYG